MKQSPLLARSLRGLVVVGLVGLGLPRVARAQGFATAVGFVLDSIHNAPLAGAYITVQGTNRVTRTLPDGRYQLDSIPPGSHRVMVVHALLDTIGIPMSTRPVTFTAGETTTLDLAIPSGDRIISL